MPGKKKHIFVTHIFWLAFYNVVIYYYYSFDLVCCFKRLELCILCKRYLHSKKTVAIECTALPCLRESLTLQEGILKTGRSPISGVQIRGSSL